MASSTGLRLYNTLTRAKEDFSPIDRSNVRMYVCGPTVYDHAHIGNARPAIVFDVLFRLLRHLYGESHVTYVRNITDVDDKINARAARDHEAEIASGRLTLNEAIRKVTEVTEAQYRRDVAALGCLEPTFQPRATEYIPEMRALIERLVDIDVAYVADDHVLFSPTEMNKRKGPRYGALARRSLDEMLAGARVDVASYKRDEMDFVLWKPSKEGEPGWPSPAGITVPGRPGWHIECSAMSMAKLLEPLGGGLWCDDPLKNTFDIHAGGIDLVFPHHENEIAQSCCAFGTERMANVWMHNGFLQVEGQKMSKSLGNFLTIAELLADWPGEVLRFNMLGTHYRQPIDWTLKGLEASAKRVDDFYSIAAAESATAPAAAVVEALLDDLNTPNVIAELARLRRSVMTRGAPEDFAALAGSLRFLGFLSMDGDAWQAARVAEAEIDAAATERRIAERLAFIRDRNWAEADRIRDELLAEGVQLKDGKDPSTGERVTTWEVRR